MPDKNVYLDRAQTTEFEELADLVLSLPLTETKNKYKVDEYQVIQNLVGWIQEHPIFVLKNIDNKMVGVLVLAEENLRWWDSTPNLSNPIMYIKPEYRSLNNFTLLLGAAENYAKEVGIEFLPGLFFVDNYDTKSKLMKKYKYEQVGTLFKKAV